MNLSKALKNYTHYGVVALFTAGLHVYCQIGGASIGRSNDHVCFKFLARSFKFHDYHLYFFVAWLAYFIQINICCIVNRQWIQRLRQRRSYKPCKPCTHLMPETRAALERPRNGSEKCRNRQVTVQCITCNFQILKSDRAKSLLMLNYLRHWIYFHSTISSLFSLSVMSILHASIGLIDCQLTKQDRH